MDCYHNLAASLFTVHSVTHGFLKFTSDYVTSLLKSFDFSLNIKWDLKWSALQSLAGLQLYLLNIIFWTHIHIYVLPSYWTTSRLCGLHTCVYLLYTCWCIFWALSLSHHALPLAHSFSSQDSAQIHGSQLHGVFTDTTSGWNATSYFLFYLLVCFWYFTCTLKVFTSGYFSLFLKKLIFREGGRKRERHRCERHWLIWEASISCPKGSIPLKPQRLVGFIISVVPPLGCDFFKTWAISKSFMLYVVYNGDISYSLSVNVYWIGNWCR